MTPTITFYENSGFLVDGKSSQDIASFPLNPTPRLLDSLSELRVQIGNSKVPVLNVTHRSIKARHIVGYFAIEDLNIQVLPKIYNSEIDPQNQTRSAVSNLAFMLEKSEEADIWAGNETDQAEASDSILEVLVRVYATRLKRYLSLGAKRNYDQISEQTSQIKGRMTFGGNLFQPKYVINPACTWDEWTENNALNRSIHRLTCFLISKTKSAPLKALLSLLVARMRLTMDIGKDYEALLACDSKSTNPHHSSFIRLAKMIAQKIHPAMSAGRKDQLCIGFDMGQLFESYVYGLLYRHRKQLELKYVEYQSGIRLISHYSGLEDFGTPKPSKLKNTFADIVIIDKDGAKFVLDAKYKLLNDDSKSLGISNADIYQMTSYQRLHAVSQVDAFGVLIFPQRFEEPFRLFKLNTSKVQSFGCHSLDLMCELRRSEDRLVNEIARTLKAVKSMIW